MHQDTQTASIESTELQRALFLSVNKVYLAFRQFVQQKLKQHEYDLTFEMLQVLGQLWEQDGINQQELANAILKDKASLVYLIDNLTRRELVSRQEDPTDRRNKLIFLTVKGHQLRTEIRPWVEEMYSNSDKGITTEEMESTISYLQKIIVNLS